ncbi:metallophosphoesterase family protein [Flammeovirga aprica]|uniref:Phosphoesterase n=1 Tax=Flammeovirga aprica JL-4 TaxID=694437 RepID=A0A7X9RTG2_9BACT|nr:metallophosphoesterase family protein [Flammeovirga aprica]NME68386.1 metallophosphoesterase family protein [Flammeovirga aprica JL-4]
MKEIGIISDTHSYIDEHILKNLEGCDEIWHAGDIGEQHVMDELEKVAPTKAVYGNIDDGSLRATYPEEAIFEVDGVKVYIIHIGGYPPKYTAKLKKRLKELQPDLFICGHSHILKVIPDQERKLLHINPGAAGRHGFHRMRTLIRLRIDEGKPKDLKVVELGLRAKF